MKVYIYYKDKSVYAYTNNKNLKNEFEQQRNLSMFQKKVINMNKEEYDKFHNNLYNNELLKISYTDCNDDYYIISTNHEERLVMEFSDNIIKEIEDLTYEVEKCNLKNKYLKSFKYLLEIVEVRNKELTYLINDMYLFTILFGDTMK